ncbi:hypothetical protein HDV04_004803 [Boothiomyces sp. JEL0838]|nr:hypothetical protein HDV04_004803 [Boothiomyces sp. JEL0838]
MKGGISKIISRDINSLIKKSAPSLSPKELVLDSVLEAKFFSQHRPLALGLIQPTKKLPIVIEPQPEVMQEWYLDEYAKLFGGFIPFSPPGSQIISDTAIDLDEHLSTLLSQLKIREPSVGPRRSGFFLISIMKRRRKKMNKHKWKKYRREVRNSSRYNTERNKNKGKIRRSDEEKI